MKKKLKDVCDFYSGTGFPTQYQGEDKGDYPFYKVGDIAKNVTVGNIYLELCSNYIDDVVVKKIKGCILPENTVVFAKIGEALKLNRRAITSCACLVDNNVMGIAPRSEVLRIQYFYFLMKNLQLQTLAESTTVPSVRKTRLEKYEIEVPSLLEQEEIEKKLIFMQKVITKRKLELLSLDNLVKARFIEVFGDPKDNPFGWKVTPLSNLIMLANNGMSRRGNDKNGNIVIRLVELQDGYIDYSNPNRIQLTEMEKEKYLLQDGDFLFVRVNGNPSNVGRCAVFSDVGENIYHNDHIIRVHFNEKLLDGLFASVFINSNYGKRQFMSQIKTSAGQYTISQNGIGAVLIILPPIELQREFADFVRQITKSKSVIEKSLKELETLQASLMQKYFS